jgi:MerR family transcriptional regulator, copper efflux regulator
MDSFTIGQVARASGIGIETIRFYEREGLLELPARRSSGYRQFDENAIIRLRFIKQAQRLGFTLREIKELLALKLDPDCSRAKVRERAVAKVEDIDARIKDLRRMKKALSPLIVACNGKGTLAGCPILVAMDSELPPTGLTKSTRK